MTTLARYLPHLGRLGRATRWKRAKAARPRVWAHRGDSAHEVENTMAAFEAARRVGADGIELDVRFDGDDTVVVFHDDTLQRLAGRPERVDRLSATERAKIRVGGQPIPTLADVLDWLGGSMEINVEIKSQRLGREGKLAAATARVIADSKRAEQVLISSFDPFALAQLHRHLPEVACAYLFHDEQPFVFRNGWVGRATGATLLHPQHTLCTAEHVKAWHAAGMPVNTWTVDDPAELRRLAEVGVDGVFANDPKAALAVYTST